MIDLEENLQHWYRTLSEHAEDIGLTEEDKERLIHGKQDELSEIIQNIIDRYNVRVNIVTRLLPFISRHLIRKSLLVFSSVG